MVGSSTQTGIPAASARHEPCTSATPLSTGIIIAVCSCYGRVLLSKTLGLCCRRRRKRKQQDAYEQIACLRQQLHDLRSRMSTEAE